MYSQGTYVTSTAHVPSVPINEALDLNGIYAVPVGGRVFHVRGSSATGKILTYDDQYGENTANMNRKLYATVLEVLPYCVAKRGDKIVVHPNHTESLGSADSWANLVEGVSIIGLGTGDTRPTFTFTDAASTLLLDQPGVKVVNCRFLCAGPSGTTALTVAAPLTVSGEGTALLGNYFEIGIDADQLCTNFCNVTGANVTFYGNEIRGLAQASTPTSCITLTGANYFKFVGNRCKAALSAAAKGFIANSTTASADVFISDNFFHQWKSDSSACISLAANSVTTGTITRNRFRVMNDASVQGVVYSGTGVDVQLFENTIVNNTNETGLLNQGTASA
jgi:hypothetical protein